MKRIKGFGGRSYGKKGLKNFAKLQEEFQKKLEDVEKRYSQEVVEVSAGGGAFRIVMRCDYRLEDVEFDEDLLSDPEMLKDLMLAGFNEAIEKVNERRNEIASEIMGELGLMGFGGMV